MDGAHAQPVHWKTTQSNEKIRQLNTEHIFWSKKWLNGSDVTEFIVINKFTSKVISIPHFSKNVTKKSYLHFVIKS